MSTQDALPAVCARFRSLIAGVPTPTVHSVTPGTFRAIDNTVPLAQQPQGIFASKPFEVVWTEEGIPDETGPEPVYGNLVESSATILVRVGYLQGVGRSVNVSDDAARDARLIRRVLEEPGNYDQGNTGLEKVDRIRSRLGLADGDGRVLMEMTFRVRMREDQPE